MRITGSFVAIGSGLFSSAAGISASAATKAFDEFVEKYGKLYSSPAERRARFETFQASLALVEAENAKDLSYKLAINSFADMALEDFGSKRLGYSAPTHATKLWRGAPRLGAHLYSGKDLAESVDWTGDGAVTAVKDQGSCGSCWTFSTTGALEGAWQIATGKLVAMSEQQLVDCAKNDGLDGCSGGEMDPAFTYLEDHVTCTESGYPYAQQQNGECGDATCEVAIPQGGIVGFKDVPEGDTKALMEAVAQQPVSTAVQAGQSAFQMYSSGVITQECNADVDHAVLIVGYGSENGTEYWKIKNSWGANWGENGFVRLARGKADDGECGVKVMPSYPIVRQSDVVV